MLKTLAIQNFRSIRRLVLPLSQLNVVVGANGVGKSNLYKTLRTLAGTAFGSSIDTLAREGGLESVLWAGPETVSKAVKRGEFPVQGGPRKSEVRLLFGFENEEFGFAIDYGMPSPPPGSMFTREPEIKREVIWRAGTYHHSRVVVDRKNSLVRARDDTGSWHVVEQYMPSFESVLSRLIDPQRVPELLLLREQIRSWRFYDHFRIDPESPARRSRMGVRTPVMSQDGSDLASSWQTIWEIGDATALDDALTDAFPGASVNVTESGGRFQLEFHQHGLLRPLTQGELSDGTLRYLLWIVALLTPRPPELMVLNEPETSLHPDLLPALARLIWRCSKDTQLWVISHSQPLIDALSEQPQTNLIQLSKELGETVVAGQELFDIPAWKWPSRS